MQPRDLWSPPVPEQYAVTDTDRRIAEENVRVQVFENPLPPIPRHEKLLTFISGHRMTLLVVISSILLLGGGTTLAIMNIHKITNGSTLASTTNQENTGNSKNVSGGGSDEDSDSASDAGDEADYEDTEEDTDDEDYEDTGDDGDYEDTDDEDSGNDGVIKDTPNDSIVTPAPTPVPAKPIATSPHKFTVASWNVSALNKSDVGKQVLSIFTKTQVLGLQTLHTKAERDSVKNNVLCSSCAYSGYQPSYSGSESGPSDLHILWNKSSFSAVGSGSYRKMSDAASSKSYSYAARYATWIKLQSKVNNKQFYVVDTQTMSVGESGGKPGSDSLLISRYQTHMTNLKNLITELKKANLPIYIVGIFNVNYRYDRYAYTSYFPYATLKALGVRSNWDLMGLSGISSSATTEDSGNRITDYIFTWQRSDVVANAIAISTSRYGSDHYVAFFTNTIK